MLLPIPQRRQLSQADCLAACAAMILDYLGKPAEYERLLALLDIGPIGAPRRNIVRLARLGVDVVYREATPPILIELLRTGTPVIAFVDTAELPYWSSATNHAVVVVGVEGDDLLVNDPAFVDVPIRVPLDEFELAWLNADYMCTIIDS